MSPSQARSGAIPKKLVGAVLVVMLVVAGVLGVSSSSQNEPSETVGQEKNVFVSSAQDHKKYYHYKCTAGTFRFGKICKRCPIGHYCVGEKKIACPSSEYQDCEGQSKCVPIPCGYEGAFGGKYYKGYKGGFTSIKKCGIGYYRSKKMKKCTKVPPGSFGEEKGLCEYMKCHDGQYQPKPGQAECLDCKCGTFSKGYGATSCTPCGKYEWQMMDGAHFCMKIPQGYIAKKNRCWIKRCPYGTYRTIKNYKYICKKAECGYYVPKGATKQIKCPAGTYQPDEGKWKCKPIPKGYELKNKKRCNVKKCKKGYHQNEEGLDECKPCRPGSFTDKPGQKKCEPCPCGEFAGSSGSKACDGCKAGTFQEFTGQSECAPIELGHELAKYTGPRCGVKPCEPGTFRGPGEVKNKFDKCKKCPKGRAVPYPGAFFCPKCPCGKFQDKVGQEKCKKCKDGEWQADKGQKSCDPVPKKKKASPNKCKLIKYYYKPPPAPLCSDLSGGKYPKLKSKGKLVALSYPSSANCRKKCKSIPKCLCYGYEVSTKKCYVSDKKGICTVTKGYYGKDFVYGQCRGY